MKKGVEKVLIPAIATIVGALIGAYATMKTPTIINLNIDGQPINISSNKVDEIIIDLETKNNELQSKIEFLERENSDLRIENSKLSIENGASSTSLTIGRTMLSQVKPLKQEGVYDWTETNKDNFGNKYTNGYLFSRWSFNSSYATFVFNKEYTALKATITPASNEFERGNGVRVVFYSLSDYDTAKLYETDEITMLTRPYSIIVSLLDVDTLMIELQTPSGCYADVGLVNAFLE